MPKTNFTYKSVKQCKSCLYVSQQIGDISFAFLLTLFILIYHNKINIGEGKPIFIFVVKHRRFDKSQKHMHISFNSNE